MAGNIIDTLMQTFKRAEKDATTLSITGGGEDIDLFGSRKLVSEDFDSMLSVLLYDKEGQDVLASLHESGNIDQLKKLWKMGGSPALTFGSEGSKARGHYTRGEDSKINLLTHGGKKEDYSSKELLTIFVDELSHGIGEFRPSLNKMSRDEIYYELMDKNTTLFDSAVSPADSSLAWEDWAKHDAIKVEDKVARYTKPGTMEHQTHQVIGNAVKFWMKDIIGIDLWTPDWGAE